MKSFIASLCAVVMVLFLCDNVNAQRRLLGGGCASCQAHTVTQSYNGGCTGGSQTVTRSRSRERFGFLRRNRSGSCSGGYGGCTGGYSGGSFGGYSNGSSGGYSTASQTTTECNCVCTCPNCGFQFNCDAGVTAMPDCHCCDQCTGKPGCQCGCADCTCNDNKSTRPQPPKETGKVTSKRG